MIWLAIAIVATAVLVIVLLEAFALRVAHYLVHGTLIYGRARKSDPMAGDLS